MHYRFIATIPQPNYLRITDCNRSGDRDGYYYAAIPRYANDPMLGQVLGPHEIELEKQSRAEITRSESTVPNFLLPLPDGAQPTYVDGKLRYVTEPPQIIPSIPKVAKRVYAVVLPSNVPVGWKHGSVLRYLENGTLLRTDRDGEPMIMTSAGSIDFYDYIREYQDALQIQFYPIVAGTVFTAVESKDDKSDSDLSKIIFCR